MSAILGLDLSTRCAAAVAVPLGWNLEFWKVRTLVVGEPLGRSATDAERARRNAEIAMQIVAFTLDYGCSVAWFESYAFAARTAHAHSLGEVGGVVRHELVRAGVEIRTANVSTARKLLLGKIPRGKGAAKNAVAEALRAAGASFRTLDESDAFCCANFGLAEAGLPFFGQAPRSAP